MLHGRATQGFVVPVRLDAATGCCTECGQASRSVHSRYHRHPSDLPLSTSQTKLRIEVRRFYCLNPTCRRRTFCGDASRTRNLRTACRRTRRLGEAQARVGRACGGAGGACLLAPSTCRQAARPCCGSSHRMPMPDTPAHIQVGIDEWAIRKGSRYGTIVVDLDRHRVIDLFPERTALTVAGWLLERHSSVETRRPGSLDRVGARGASLGAPHAQQVADRMATCSPTCGRPSNAGSTAPMPGCVACRSSLARPLVLPGAAAPLPALRRSWKRGHRAGCDGRPSTMRSAVGTPAGNPCSRSPWPGAGSCDGTQVCQRRSGSRRGCLTVPGRACLIRTSQTWRVGSTKAASTPWPCGARSGSRAIQGRAGKSIASSPSAERGPVRSGRKARKCQGFRFGAAWIGSPVAASTAVGVAARPADLGVG